MMINLNFSYYSFLFITERRNYYKRDLPPVTAQPPQHSAVAASILESHASSLTAQQEWETEWNTMGLPSRLSPEVGDTFSNLDIVPNPIIIKRNSMCSSFSSVT